MSVCKRHVHSKDRKHLRPNIQIHMEEKGCSREEVLALLAGYRSRDVPHSRIFSSMCTVPHEIAVAAHALFVSTNLGDPGLYPGTAEIERRLIADLGDLLHGTGIGGYATSGGTESNNMALIGAALANKRSGMHIITTAFEHPSVYEPMFFLEELGFRVTYLTPGPEGTVTVEALKEALSPDTILVSVMAVNNEVGAVQDITALGAAVKAYNPAILFHVDAIQAYGKFRIYPKRQNIDMLSVSAHKLHGPKGCGFLYVKEKTKIKPILHGGGLFPGVIGGGQHPVAVLMMYIACGAPADKLFGQGIGAAFFGKHPQLQGKGLALFQGENTAFLLRVFFCE